MTAANDSSNGFGSWFAQVTQRSEGPYVWQCELAADGTPANRLIRIPTGFGKTAGAVLAWLYHRIERADARWPRRLVYALPMRVLVEQTEAEIRGWLARAGLLWEGPDASHEGKVGVHVLMGGSDAADWHLYPEACAILIGTQDMLLSRALNRGYGAPRARWPMEFGLLHQDALWVMDEVQLMDVGLATSAQLQAFRSEDESKALRPCCTWWMSATLQPEWLRSVDTEPMLANMERPTQIPEDARQGGLWEVRKTCRVVGLGDTDALAAQIGETHQHGTLTLAVLNTVAAARAVHAALTASLRDSGVDVRLVHSQFRPAERASWRDAFLSRGAPLPTAGRIIVATQVVEAGVDLSARTLVTELAPWSSLVQRFGRCARDAGEAGTVVVVDRGWTEKDARRALPYDLAGLAAAREALAHLPDVAPRSLEAFESQLSEAMRCALYTYDPLCLLLRREWEDLFDTTPDLSGADIDISRFIRSGGEHDCLVFWRDVPEDGPSDEWQPAREECCAVPFLHVRDWLCGEKKKGLEPQAIRSRKPASLKYARPVAWIWDWVEGVWNRRTRRGDLLPGRVVLVDAAFGGYDDARGWDPKAVPAPPLPGPVAPSAQEQADAAQARENLSETGWQTIAAHDGEVAAAARQIAAALALPSELVALLELAGLWHDVGKAHPCFQGSMRLDAGQPPQEAMAKAPREAWNRAYLYRAPGEGGEYRPGLRHELASTLALFAALLGTQRNHAALEPRPASLCGEGCADSVPARTAEAWEEPLATLSPTAFNLLAYLVAAHHGKVRMRLHAAPQDEDYTDRDGRGLPVRGVREGDTLAPIVAPDGATVVSTLTLSLEPARLGLSDLFGPSWTERTLALLRAHGPGTLAFLEAVLRAADIRVSQGRPAGGHAP